MQKRLRVLLVAISAIAVGLLLWKLWDQEPVYEGKPLSTWVKNLEKGSYSFDERKTLGSNTIPVLLIALQRCDKPGQDRYRVAFEASPAWLRSVLPNPGLDADKIRMGAAVTLIQMGEEAKPAIPRLIELLKTSHDFNVRLKVAFALLGLGRGETSVTAALAEASNDPNWQVRAFAADALKQLDPAASAKAGTNSPSG